MRLKDRIVYHLFPAYVFIFNLQGKVLGLFRLDHTWRLIPYFDLDVWKKHPRHPSKKKWVRELVRHIYFATGMVPSEEHQHLLNSEDSK